MYLHGTNTSMNWEGLVPGKLEKYARYMDYGIHVTLWL